MAGCAHHIVQRGNNRQDVFFVGYNRDSHNPVRPGICRAGVVSGMGWAEVRIGESRRRRAVRGARSIERDTIASANGP